MTTRKQRRWCRACYSARILGQDVTERQSIPPLTFTSSHPQRLHGLTLYRRRQPVWQFLSALGRLPHRINNRGDIQSFPRCSVTDLNVTPLLVYRQNTSFCAFPGVLLIPDWAIFSLSVSVCLCLSPKPASFHQCIFLILKNILCFVCSPPLCFQCIVCVCVSLYKLKSSFYS